MSKNVELEEIRKLLDQAETKIRLAKSKLFGSQMHNKASMIDESDEDNVTQGVFDGENMIGQDKKIYQIPVNYSSKSKLIPGDVLKLTILEDGKHIYKQIGPIKRINLTGVLEEVSEGEFQVNVNGKKYKILLASITYYKAKSGDKVSVIVPKDEESEWSALDSVLQDN